MKKERLFLIDALRIIGIILIILHRARVLYSFDETIHGIGKKNLTFKSKRLGASLKS
jgi:hypothetical protein